ncbi:MAG: hypothetical protein IJM46_00145 [Oscillospiraceae bacterium]|nr:hypothetical protein [Oscillospiraceae bacterium]
MNEMEAGTARAMIHATVSVSSAEQLDTLLNRLRTVRDVISADRAAY